LQSNIPARINEQVDVYGWKDLGVRLDRHGPLGLATTSS
jgi:hypothetical protein